MVAEVKATAKVVVARQMGEAGGCGGECRQHGDRESSVKSASAGVSTVVSGAIGFRGRVLEEQRTFQEASSLPLSQNYPSLLVSVP